MKFSDYILTGEFTKEPEKASKKELKESYGYGIDDLDEGIDDKLKSAGKKLEEL